MTQPRDLHPVAWWIWAIGLAAAASFTTNPLILVGLAAVAATVVAFRAGRHPWAASFRLYLALAALIVVTRVLFRVLFGGVETGHVLLDLPAVPLPEWVAGIQVLGPVTRESLLAGLYDGLRLAAIVVCVGAANSLANPKRLLASVPSGLYEIGTALVVAVTIFPQLADSARRVRAAQALRGGPTSRAGRLRRFLVPVLEDALDRSIMLAAAMDTRGYGRVPSADGAHRWVTGSLMVLALVGLGTGSYAALDTTAPRWLAVPMLLGGAAAAAAGLFSAGRRVERSRYRPDRWRGPELAVVACGLVTGAVGWWLVRAELLVAHPGVQQAPSMSVLALLGLAVALLPVLLAPPPAGSRLRQEALA